MSEIILRDHLEEVIDSKILEAIYAAGLDSEEDEILYSIKESPVYKANINSWFKRCEHLGELFLNHWRLYIKEKGND